jgi:hypothetical protein
MSLVFQNIDLPPPSPPCDCVPPTLVRGEDTITGGSIFWKTRDTALYSTYVSTLWFRLSNYQTSDYGYRTGNFSRYRTIDYRTIDLIKLLNYLLSD